MVLARYLIQDLDLRVWAGSLGTVVVLGTGTIRASVRKPSMSHGQKSLLSTWP